MTNRLYHSTSPYLIQHANNPVDWYPWGKEALEKARQDDKPIFLSIGYAACHWCHVMAHESFEDPDTASIMNEHFVNIKVDREQRPDLDTIYMQATVAMTGSGGWPMSVFLTPQLEPFYAGTYFPPKARYNLPSFQDVLLSIADAWKHRRDEIQNTTSRLTSHLQQQFKASPSNMNFSDSDLESAANRLVQAYDWSNGGWGAAPKFPQPMALEFLLRRSVRQAGSSSEKRVDYLSIVRHALNAMARGGMYDVLGGGFSRYSVDNFWRVPHFEKMLYDNAQLAQVYLHTWMMTEEPLFLQVCTETLEFITREMTSPEGGFYASLDADSEGEEGRYYIWSMEQIRRGLDDADRFEFMTTAYGLTERGNWEGKIVLQRAVDDATLAARFSLSRDQVKARLSACHASLLKVRELRVRPATDDKVLLSWNSLMLSTFARAAGYLSAREENDLVLLGKRYYKTAMRNARFLIDNLYSGGRLKRAWRNGMTTGEVFLEDYAAFIIALLDLYQVDFDPYWFSIANSLTGEMIDLFQDPAGSFFDTPHFEDELLLRPKDLQDNATPSGNALAADALLRLAAFSDSGQYRDLAEKALQQAASPAAQYPTAFARWLSAVDFALGNVQQVAVIGDPSSKATQDLISVFRGSFRPNAIIAASPFPPPDESPPLLFDRPLLNGQPAAYVCQEFVCKSPVNTAEEMQNQL